jgi:hypothetical protein
MVVGIRKRNWDGEEEKWTLFSIFSGLASSVASGIYQGGSIRLDLFESIYTVLYKTGHLSP